MEKFWAPLYRCEPLDIQANLSSLLTVLRNTYNSSLFFNTSTLIGGFLQKVTNQITIACRNYLTKNGTLSIWTQSLSTMTQKIKICKQLSEYYQDLYYSIVDEMQNNPKEKPFECSANAIFGNVYSLDRRMNEVSHILQSLTKYSVLDRIRISGMEVFAKIIKTAFSKITSKPYDPLAHRLTEFDHDYENFLKEVEIAEYKMQEFLKNYINEIPNSHSMLLAMERFEKLDLDCLCMERRYLDIACQLQREIEGIKDVCNEQRSNPVIPRNTPPVAGKIMWIRSLYRSIDEPMKVCIF